MPSADEVKPGKWSRLEVLFDNGWYSIISGDYDGQRAIGERWNGQDDELGFPSTFGHAQWHVVPLAFCAYPFCRAFLKKSNVIPIEEAIPTKRKSSNCFHVIT